MKGTTGYFISRGVATLLLGTCCAFLPHSTLGADNPYWSQFGDQPVRIEQVNPGGGSQTLVFQDYRDGMLIAELPGGVGEVSLPVSETMAQNLRFNFPEQQEVRRLVSEGKHALALERLRPVAYPLIRFARIPEAFYHIHVPIRLLLEALVGAGELDEAMDLASRIPLDQVDPAYSARVLALGETLLRAERLAEAARTLEALPFGEGYGANIAPTLNLANHIRTAGAYAAVIPLYRKILAAAPQADAAEVRIWLAYSLVLADRIDEAGPMIDALEEPDSSDTLFSLFKLLQGSRYYGEARHREALDVLTRGFVKSEASYVWVPEMLYFIGDCYARTGNPTAARNTWREITALYPDSGWAGRARDSLKSLPTPAMESADDSEPIQ